MKKQVWKKLISAALCAALIAVPMTACSGGGESETSSGGASQSSESGASASDTGGEETPEGRTISIIAPHSSVCLDAKDIPWIQDLEAKFKEEKGYTIEWTEIASENWAEKRQTLYATGDIPDIIYGDGSTPADVLKFSALFEDLSDDLDAMPNVQEMFEAKPMTKYLAENEDGSIYALSRYSRFWPRTSNHQYINKEWLDNLGLEVPTTWDELYDVLVAFRDGDANGNGDPTDEIPMDFAPLGTTGFGTFQPDLLVASTGIPLADSGNSGYYVDNGTVKNFFVEVGFKDSIAFMNKLWNEGLISQKAFTQDYSSYQSMGRGGGDENTALVGFTWGWVSLDRFGPTLESQYVAIPPLSSEEGVEPSWSYESSLNYGTGSVMVSRKTEHKDACLWLINELYSQDNSMYQVFGSQDVVLDKTGDKSYTVLGSDDPTIDQGTWQMMNTFGGCIYIRDDLDVQLGPDLQQAAEQTKPYDDILDKMEEGNDVLPWSFLKFNESDATTLSNNNTALMNYGMSQYSTWITSGGVEEGWDAYVDTMNGYGLQQNIELVQKAFDEYNKVMNEG